MTTVDERLELRDPDAYKAKLRDALGGRDPLESMTRTADALATIVGERTADVLRRRPYEGKWTPTEIIGHLMDVEWVFGFRTRTMVCDDRPMLSSIDQDLWTAAQAHNERDPRELLQSFRTLRELNLRPKTPAPPCSAPLALTHAMTILPERSTPTAGEC